MRHTPRLAAALAALLMMAAACSSTSEQVTSKIQKDVQSKLKLDTKPDTTCPDKAKAKKGNKFKCTVTIEGEKLTVDVLFTKDDFFEATFEGDVEKIPELEAGLQKQAGAKSVDCSSKKLEVITPTKPLKCTANMPDGTKQTVTFSFKDGKVSSTVG